MDISTEPSTSKHLLAERMRARYNRVRDRACIIEYCINDLCGINGIITGSRAEGPHNHDSDTDFVKFSNDLVAVNEIAESCSQNRVKLLMVSEGAYPGHVKLKVTPEIQFQGNLEILQQMECLSSLCVDNRMYISTKKIRENWSKFAPGCAIMFGNATQNLVQGPSVQLTWTESNQQFFMDTLYAIPCSNWPDGALEWYNRERKYGWPDINLIENIKAKGTFLVPFGRSPFGEISDFDWRISFSHAERELMWSLDSSRMLCFDFLKRLSKILKQRFPTCYQSYYLKTSFFWILENSQPDKWHPNSTIERATDCITWLMENLRAESIPNYFIPKNNIFRKVPEGDTEDLVRFLSGIADRRHSLWQTFVREAEKGYRDDLLFQYHVYMNAFTVVRQLTLVTLSILVSPELCISRLQKNIDSLIKTDNSILVHLKPLIRVLKGHLGSLAICSEIQKSQNVEVLAKFKSEHDIWEYLEDGCHVDKYSGRLKRATILDQLSRHEETLGIIDELLSQDRDHVVYMSSFKVERDESFTDYPKDGMSYEDFMKEYLALDVVFLPAELAITPTCIQQFLSTGKTVLIHPITYALFLRFTILFKLEKYNNLKNILAALSHQVHRNTSWLTQIETQLLGHCETLFKQLSE